MTATGAAQAPLLRVRGLSVRFPGADAPAADDVGFELRAGRVVAIVGQSGSGKSVTARALVGLVGGGAAVGAEELTLDGADLRSLSERGWRRIRGRRIGFVLQDALQALDPLKRVGSEVGEVLREHRLAGRSERVVRARELLADVGVPDPELRARQYPHELSGGLRQRALIASSIAAGPGVLIADEPTTALDVTVQAQVLGVLRQLRDAGTGILLISHDLAVVSQLADEVLVMHGGRVVEHGPVDEVLRAPRHQHTRDLLAAVTRGPAVADPASDEAPRVPVLTGRGLRKTYRLPGGGELVAVRSADLDLPEGLVTGVVGESGSGKSTLAALLLGLTPPTAGVVEYDGQPFSQLTEARRRPLRREIGLVPQDPYGSFDPRSRVGGIVEEPLILHTPLRRAERHDRVVELLAEVGLGPELLQRTPAQLSGGQRQRVAIARALITSPRVLVCDEPLSALDATVQAQILDLLGEMSRKRRLTMLFISHDLGVVRRICDRVVVMKDGDIVEEGAADALFADPRHPYTRDLLAAVPVLRV
ncbi:dipeptide ABC transporter ATP-binding protein [Jiangella endophytica]|uniref:dipeptide ABC transporter ATP-binding protein n=1 Tax=Jiangella endophytica TaxID=1623398 RepID=UPI000E351D6B|nr:ABC transporter ATP-binding protein [Jiangella endophytica]